MRKVHFWPATDTEWAPGGLLGGICWGIDFTTAFWSDVGCFGGALWTILEAKKRPQTIKNRFPILVCGALSPQSCFRDYFW